jgi:hypothetical protein
MIFSKNYYNSLNLHCENKISKIFPVSLLKKVQNLSTINHWAQVHWGVYHNVAQALINV